MPRRWFLSVVLPLALLPVTVALADFSGPVISVLDGDTIEVLHNRRAERIRQNSVAYPFTVFHTEALRLLQKAKVSRRKIMATRCCD